MKRITLLICILFLVTSCEIQYDGETKMVVTGKIIDQNGIPLPEKDIEVTIDGGTAFLSHSSDLISYGKSDQKGNFTLIFPSPKGDNSIYISINNMINQPNELQVKEISANQNNFKNYKLDLKDITLYKNESITTLKLILNNTSKSKQLIDIKIEGKLPNSYINLNPVQNDTFYYLETNYQVIKNQNIILKYTIVDHSNATPTTNSVSIPIVNDAVTYTITY